MERLEKVLTLCSISRTMYGLVFMSDKYVPLNKNELEEVLKNLETKYKHTNFHYLCEQTGLLTHYIYKGSRQHVEQLDATEVNNLALRYEVHTGFNLNNTRSRVPFVFGDDVI